MDRDEIRVAVISDTHGLLRRSVVREVQDCACILHAGDIIRESDLDELALYGSLYAVRGNNDVWQRGVKDLAGDDEDQVFEGSIEYECPHCGATVEIDPDEVDFDEDALCPQCGKELFPELPEEGLDGEPEKEE